MNKKKLVLGITSPGSILLIEGQAKYFADNGYDVYLMCPWTEKVEDYCRKENCTHLEVDIERNINFKKDFKTLLKVYKTLRRVKPDIINVGTPKMGLLGMTAGFLLGIKKRIYTCRGFRYEHEKGKLQTILMDMERITAKLAHKIVCIAPSVKEKGVADKIFSAEKAVIIGSGSSNGVDILRYNTASVNQADKEALISRLDLSDKFVYGFVGRIVDRKGIVELYEAFDIIYKENPNARLVILGKEFYDQLTYPDIVQKITDHPGVFWEGFQRDVPLYMSVFDVLVLPAWWEGFGNALIQAAAMGVPVISTTGTGCCDAVKPGFNGLLVTPKSVEELAGAMRTYYTNSALRQEHGYNGISWAANFKPETIWKGLNDIYNNRL